MITKKLAITLIILIIIAVGVLVAADLKPGSDQIIANPPAPEKIKIKVFFNNDKLDPEISCYKVFPVEREIIKTPAIARAALAELLAGTTPTEKESGFVMIIEPGSKIQSLTIENGIAKVDFNEQLEAHPGGSCRAAAIRAQISETLKQFPSVENVIISINGNSEDILQP